MIRGLLVAFLLAVIASSGVVFAAEMSAPLATMSGVADDELSALLDGGVTLRAVSGSLLNESSAEAFIVQDAEVEYDLIAAAGLLADVSINVSEGQVIELVANPAFIPQPLPGFGAVYGEVWAIAVDDDGQATLEAGAVDSAGRWIGVRNRYFTALLSGIEGGQVEVFVDAENQPRVTITPEPGQQTVFFKLYAGPVEQQSLVAADPVLTKMLFAALWDFLRWLCFGMLWLLTTIHGVVGNIGLSIILLSVAVKILMSPLTKAADRLQASVNTTAALLQPELADIKRNFKGEEAHNMVLAVYKKHGVHPLYTMKSLAGFLLQIPIFIAAFDMLGENYALYQASFLWIDDLSKPDQWLPLLINVPFFGGYLNLLPCLMTFFTLLTSWLQRDETLTEDLARSQQNRLFWMAGAFFLLFYTFPAGMVLYWTTNNVLALGRESFARIRGA